MRHRSLSIAGLALLASTGRAHGEERRLLTVQSPCPGPACELPAPVLPQAQELRIVYLNFEGVTLTASQTTDDATQNKSAILRGAVASGQSRTIPPFDIDALDSTGGLTREQIVARVVSDLYESHAPYNIEFVTERPETGPYSMVVFGGSCQSVAGKSGCAGIALLDCGDYMASNITFAFPGGRRVADLAVTAAQEGAHALGLAHTTDKTDIMYPYLREFIPTEFGEGPLPNGDQSCGGVQYQDSGEKLMQIIGYRGQDTSGPTITITTPAPGQVIEIGAPVEANITDVSEIVRAELVIDSVTIEEKTGPPWTFQVPEGTTAGEISVGIRAYDAKDNVNQAFVSAYLPTGEEQTCTGADACPDGLECADGLCVPGDGLGNLGATCGANEDCESQICAQADGEKRCSQECSAEVPCPDGFECRGDVACWPVADEGGGCAVGGATGPLSLIWFVGLLLAFRRRPVFKP